MLLLLLSVLAIFVGALFVQPTENKGVNVLHTNLVANMYRIAGMEYDEPARIIDNSESYILHNTEAVNAFVGLEAGVHDEELLLASISEALLNRQIDGNAVAVYLNDCATPDILASSGEVRLNMAYLTQLQLTAPDDITVIAIDTTNVNTLGSQHSYVMTKLDVTLIDDSSQPMGISIVFTVENIATDIILLSKNPADLNQSVNASVNSSVVASPNASAVPKVNLSPEVSISSQVEPSTEEEWPEEAMLEEWTEECTQKIVEKKTEKPSELATSQVDASEGKGQFAYSEEYCASKAVESAPPTGDKYIAILEWIISGKFAQDLFRYLHNL